MSDVYIPDRLKAEIEADPSKREHLLAALEHRTANIAKHEKRRDHLARARAIGEHLESEWYAICLVFEGKCVSCGLAPVQRDHIRRITAGGCDCIGNIQPLCGACNAAKGTDSTDLRNAARPGWVNVFLALMSWTSDHPQVEGAP